MSPDVFAPRPTDVLHVGVPGGRRKSLTRARECRATVGPAVELS